MKVSAALIWTMCLLAGFASAAEPAHPLPPVDAVITAFRTHSLVALGEYHGNEQAHAFVLSLLRDPRLAESVNTVVVEFGNSIYQSLIDRYVAGEEVPRSELVKVWQDTGIPHGVWDVPIYEETYTALRDINRKLPPERKLRVLLGDPPLNWSTVRSRQDLEQWRSKRDSYPAQLLANEVLNQHRKALILYGAWHADHQPRRSRGAAPADLPMLALVESNTGTKAFVVDMSTSATADIASADPAAASWPVPSLVPLKGTALGASTTLGTSATPGASRGATDPTGAAPSSLQQHYDALLYLGPPSTLTQARLPVDLVTDPAYQLMRMSRTALALIPP